MPVLILLPLVQVQKLKDTISDCKDKFLKRTLRLLLLRHELEGERRSHPVNSAEETAVVQAFHARWLAEMDGGGDI